MANDFRSVHYVILLLYTMYMSVVFGKPFVEQLKILQLNKT